MFEGLASVGVSGASGFTITPSRLTACSRFPPLIDPIGSPIPTGPADSVASNNWLVSVLIKLSVNGQAPSALPRREAYRKSVHLSRCKWSPLVRIVVRLLYLELCKKCRAEAMQYCIVRCRRPIDAAMLSRNASPSVRLKSVWALSASQSCSNVATPDVARYPATVSQYAGSVTTFPDILYSVRYGLLVSIHRACVISGTPRFWET